MEWYLMVLKKYAEFNGRSRRKEYWMFVLFNMIISFALISVEHLLGIATSYGGGFLSNIYSLAILIPSIAVGVRRLHDIGKSGWWLLIGLIPVIGWIWIIILLATDGLPGSNEYGTNPKEGEM
ncbi:MAG: hypothetical protein B7C24_05510 [Bacteroidetes bacterium 4572_77]|nr:MAG: hypothetical protein B7C24_05510 [Bacteroidetes bacterium 4572_77]